LASWAEKWQKILPQEKQLNKISTHKPFIVTQVQNKRNTYSSARNTFHITSDSLETEVNGADDIKYRKSLVTESPGQTFTQEFFFLQ